MAKLMEERELPIKFEAIWDKIPGQRFGEIIGVSSRTPHTRTYSVRWQNGKIKHYKGGAIRPDWIKHIL